MDISLGSTKTGSAGSTSIKSISNIKHEKLNSTSSTSEIDSANAAKLIASLLGITCTTSNAEPQKCEPTKGIELRDLESWNDDDGKLIDDNCYQELVDPSNTNGWSADDMFKYNEKMHRVYSNYNDTTLSKNYTTPLPKANSKANMRLATQLAKEIEEKVLAEGRITPESSDDDELYEKERTRRLERNKQLRPLDQPNNHRRKQQELSNNPRQVLVNNAHRSCKPINNNNTKATTRSSSHCSNSAETSDSASLSSNANLNEPTIRPVASSSRNILRTCLT